ncbi:MULTISPECIES: carbon-nitrogen hydrolase family protein [unclassified Geodermatophilus]
MAPVTVAAVHAAPEFLDAEASVARAAEWVGRAADRGARLVVFPEVFVPGFPYWINLYPPIVQAGLHARYAAQSVDLDTAQLDPVRAAARQAGAVVVLGVNEREGGTLYNTQVVIDERGEVIGRHRKLQPTFAERTVWGQGDGSTLSVWQTGIGRIGGLVCWEHTMNLARHALICQGEQIHAGSWPALSTLVGFREVFDPQVEAMSRNHALTGQCFVVVAQNPVTQQMLDVMEEALGPQEFLTVGGGWSAVIHPMTPYLAGPHTGPEETVLVADVDLDDIAGVKVFVDAAGHYSRREILRLSVDDEPKTALVRTSDRTVVPPRTEAEPLRPPAGVPEREPSAAG